MPLGSLYFLSNILLSSSCMRRYMIDASSKKSIEESFEAIGGEVGSEGDARTVIQWLSRLKEEWILLFDNADDPSLPLRQYIPTGNHGSIIITTRLSGMVSYAQGAESECRVSNMDPDEALELLIKLVRRQDHELSAEELRDAKALLEASKNASCKTL